MTTSKYDRILSFIDSCNDGGKLAQLVKNARSKEAHNVERAARLRLYAILPDAAPGTFEHDVWQSIHALEGGLEAERGKTVRLNRTRPKIARLGAYRTVEDLMKTDKPSDGYDMLIAMGMPERTFEAVVLRHPDRFADAERTVAMARLAALGIDHKQWSA